MTTMVTVPFDARSASARVGMQFIATLSRSVDVLPCGFTTAARGLMVRLPSAVLDTAAHATDPIDWALEADLWSDEALMIADEGFQVAAESWPSE